jgi:hypothetical protein
MRLWYVRVEMRRWVCLGLFTLAACGPPRAASDGEGEASSEGVGESGGAEGGGEGESTTAEAGGSDTGGADDTGMVFVSGEDMPTGEPCSVFEQDCPEGDKCIPNLGATSNTYACVPVTGDKQVGDSCLLFEGQADDCDANSHCFNTSINDQGEYEGTCVPFCQGTPYDDAWCPGQGETCDDYRCVFFGQVGYPICVKTCDPYLAECAEDGLNCHYENGYVDDFTCMVTTVEAQLGEACDWTNDCAAGLHCMSADVLPSCSDDYCCTPYCELGDDAGCAAQVPGTACFGPLMWSEAGTEGCSQVGVCSLEG